MDLMRRRREMMKMKPYWDYIFYPVPKSDTDTLTFLTKRINVSAGQTVKIETLKGTSAETSYKSQGYAYDARGCGGSYNNSNTGGRIAEFTVDITANGYIAIGGRYTIQDGTYSSNNDIFRGHYIKVKIS